MAGGDKWPVLGPPNLAKTHPPTHALFLYPNPHHQAKAGRVFEQVTTGGASPVDILHCQCLDVAYVNFTRCTALTRSRALRSVVLTDSESASDIEAV